MNLRTTKFTNWLVALTVALSVALSGGTSNVARADGPKCSAFFEGAAEAHAAMLPERTGITRELAKFAAENKLPFRWLEVGPPERRIKRLFVGIDATNSALVDAYLKRFNLDQPLDNGVAGTLALEFQQERPDQYYVTGVLRPGASQTDYIYRWGRPDMPRDVWWQQWVQGGKLPADQEAGILAYGHLIELNKEEQANVKYYLQHSDVNKPNDNVCKPKSDNCVAWTANIELGTSRPGANSDQRKHLFNELGVARAMAHFEIGRRLIHAASDRHTAIVTFYEGPHGLESFNTKLESVLPPHPKMSYASILRNVKISSPAENAVQAIPDGAKIFIPIAAGASPDAITALVERAALMKKGFDLHVLVNGISSNDLRKGVETTDGKFRLNALFLGGNMRELYNEGKVAYIPGNLSDFTRMMRDPQNEQFHYDAIVVRVSKPTAEGRYSLGPNNDMIMTILKNRPGIKIIAEVNENVPFTTGENFIMENQITAKFESKSELAGPAVVPPSETDTLIGRNIGQLIDSGAYLQIGIGNVFSGVPEGLQEFKRKNIKISTEMFGDPMMDMINRGIVTKAETGFAYGSSSLYRWLDHNEKVVFKETEYVNSPGRVARLKKFHAVNTAIQVNLFGEVNATMGPAGRISSPGGQVEFMSGAARSEGGKAIIALRSTAKGDSVSTIVLDLYPGQLTTPAESVTHVVTEYGIAKLQGKTESERAMALISIAHPKFRQSLIEQAIAKRMITSSQALEIAKK
jgi:acyl-CoA hydrolase